MKHEPVDIRMASTLSTSKSLFLTTSLPFVDDDIKEEDEITSLGSQDNKSEKKDKPILRRSNTDVEMSARAKIGRRLSKKFKTAEEVAREKERKRLQKMWHETYTGMCNRAAVLHHDIESKQVKPISTSSPKASAAKSPDSANVKKKHQRYLGLGQKFYDIDMEDDEKYSGFKSKLPARSSSIDSQASTASTLPISMVALESQKRSSLSDNFSLNSDNKFVDSSTQCSNYVVNNCCSRAESPTAEARPVERAVEARTGSEDGLGSMVRCLHFAHTFIANRKQRTLLSK